MAKRSRVRGYGNASEEVQAQGHFVEGASKEEVDEAEVEERIRSGRVWNCNRVTRNQVPEFI